jgi:ComF family protein
MSKFPFTLITTVSAAVTDLVFPHRCLGCGRFDTLACPDCLMASCQPEMLQLDATGAREQWGVDLVITLGPYHDPFLRQVVTGLKYQRLRGLAVVSGQALAVHLVAAPTVERHLRAAGVAGENASAPIIIPIPLHRRREAARGFNQSELIARAIALKTGWDCRPDLLVRTRFTKSQATLPVAERLHNPTAAFALTSLAWRSPSQFQRRPVLLVDDVITTGATIAAAARVLRPLQPTIIMAAAIARGQ